MEKTSRDTTVEVARGLCMITVICQHLELFHYIGRDWVFFAVPLFFIMSGFFDVSSIIEGRKCVKSIVQKLLLPAFYWEIIERLFFCSICAINAHSFAAGKWFLLDMDKPLIGCGPAWFLIALAFCKFFFYFLVKLQLRKWCVISISLIVSYIGTKYQMPFFIDEALCALPFYAIGVYTYPLVKKYVYKSNWLALLGLSCFICLYYRVLFLRFEPYGTLCYNGSYILSFLFVCGTLFALCRLSAKLENISILRKIGNHSQGILLIHLPFCHIAAVICHRIFERGSSSWIVCFFVLGLGVILLSLWLSICVEKYCPFLLGKKIKKCHVMCK